MSRFGQSAIQGFTNLEPVLSQKKQENLNIALPNVSQDIVADPEKESKLKAD